MKKQVWDQFWSKYSSNIGKYKFNPGEQDEWAKFTEKLKLHDLEALFRLVVAHRGNSIAYPRIPDFERAYSIHVTSTLKDTFESEDPCHACGKWESESKWVNSGWLHCMSKHMPSGKLQMVSGPCLCKRGQHIENETKIDFNKYWQRQAYEMLLVNGKKRYDDGILPPETSRAMMIDLLKIVDKEMSLTQYKKKWSLV